MDITSIIIQYAASIIPIKLIPANRPTVPPKKEVALAKMYTLKSGGLKLHKRQITLNQSQRSKKLV